jgi:Xaa-Pro aminopeptidase
MISIAGCRQRQHRLLQAMERAGWDSFLTANYRTVYYFTGVLTAAETPAFFALNRDGGSILITSSQAEAAADHRIALETYSIQRTLTHPWRDTAYLLQDYLASRPGWGARNAGVELGTFPAVLLDVVETISPQMASHDANDVILSLRKKKEPDEIDEICAALRYCAIAYRAAREAIAPGRTELDIYDAMARAIFNEAGTTIPFPGDFACGARGIREGGPPTCRPILAGDLYILDIFPAPALYFADTCRTFSVGPPRDAQLKAWELVMQAIHLAEKMIKPGVRAREVYRAVKDFLDSHEITQKSFWHHVGHGIGHHGHEAPRIIPGTDDVFEVGDVLTLEPGIYSESLQGGIRLEDNYVVREGGLENLFRFPMELYPQ